MTAENAVPSETNSPPTKKRKMESATAEKSDVAPVSNLLIKRLSPKARLPKRGSALAAGYDLYRCVILARSLFVKFYQTP